MKAYMFPTYPTMICRRCACSFQVIPELQIETLRHSRFECTNCNYETAGTGIKNFLKFYPRLVLAQESMTMQGIVLTTYTVGNLMEMGIFSWLKETMSFKCGSCSNQWSIAFDRDSLFFKKNPQSFGCRKCYKSPAPKTTYEFFMALNQTFENSMKFSHAQWDIFSPLNMPVPRAQIQSKIYSNKCPVLE